MIKFLNRLRIFLKTADSRQMVLTVGVTILLLTLFGYLWIFKDLPLPTKLAEAPSQTTKIFDRNNRLLYQIYQDENRTVIPLAQIPDPLKKATIAIEDKDFYKHQGINVVFGMLRAVKDMVLYRKNLQGGSTITQQLVKTALLSPERTLRRKIKEVLLAMVVEKIYTKDQILEMYLNQVPYGGTAFGVAAAAEKYFGKKVDKLNLAESAVLAGLPAAPSYYSPIGSYPEQAMKRQAQVLRRMREDGYITREEEERTLLTALNFNRQKEEIKAPHFVMYVKEFLEKKYGSQMVERGGLQVVTTLDLNLQNFAQETVASEVAKLKNLDVGNAAALITRPATGEILAMVGSADYFDLTNDGNVNVTTALRQPGSAIKPINYAVGLMKGYTPATLFIDAATCFANLAGQKPYCPQNYDGKWHGPVQLRFALGNSFNIPAVKMLALNGVHDMVATASAMGISTLNDESRFGLSLTLGGGEVKMTELATAFGVFANAGIRKDLYPILKVTDNKDKVLEENKEAIVWNSKKKHSLLDIGGIRVLPFEVAFLISHILLDNNARSQAFGENGSLRITGHTAVSVKTGTTDDKRDNWTIGYTPSFLTAVWVGNNDNSPMNPFLASGVTGAAPIWNKIMTYVLKGKPDEWPLMPANIVGLQVCAVSGKLPGDSGCPARFEYFIKGTEPKEIESGKQKILIDSTSNKMAKPGQTENIKEEERSVVKDAFTGYCLDCPHENDESVMINKWNY